MRNGTVHQPVAQHRPARHRAVSSQPEPSRATPLPVMRPASEPIRTVPRYIEPEQMALPLTKEDRRIMKVWRIILAVFVAAVFIGSVAALVFPHHAEAAKTQPVPVIAANITPPSAESDEYILTSLEPESADNNLFMKFQATIPDGSTVRLAVKVGNQYFVGRAAPRDNTVKEESYVATLMLPRTNQFPKEMPTLLVKLDKPTSDLVHQTGEITGSNVTPVPLGSKVTELRVQTVLAKRSAN